MHDASLHLIAASDATVLIEGETGTGKQRIAEELHRQSRRADARFVIVDCGSLPETLFESELFGHEVGAFTGATRRHVGAFEAAAGGTLFLDELGELPLDLQPKLLRAVETREIRRLGSSESIACDARIIAATNRDLRAEVAKGRFREDLFFRIAVVNLQLVPLRERLAELPALVDDLLDQLRAHATLREKLTAPAYLAELRAAAWPGNIRELRNHLEECVVFGEVRPVRARQQQPLPLRVESTVPYEQARRQVLASFEREYLTDLLARTRDNVARAAREAGVNRAYLHRLLRRHGLR